MFIIKFNKIRFNIYTILHKGVIWFVIACFSLSLISPQQALAQGTPSLIHLTPPCAPVILKGITINSQNPFHMNFILDQGDLLKETQLEKEYLQEDAKKLINYFLAALTIPEKDLWVNLSPIEKDRIIPDELGHTQMGRDMLTQDYLLKRLTSSLMHPEEELGEKFWEEVYSQAYEKYGEVDIDVDTFNKVWIVADKAEVFEKGQTALVVKGEMDVLLEEDYLVAQEEGRKTQNESSDDLADGSQVSHLTSDIVRNIILPAIKEEVNQGKNFEQLRQIYNSLILATWFKRKLMQSTIYQQYIDQNKIAGIDIEEKDVAQRVYDSYMKSFTKGVYNFIQEEYDPVSQGVIPRKYFSGGVTPAKNRFGRTLSETLVVHDDYAAVTESESDTLFNVDINIQPFDEDFAQAVKKQDELSSFLGKTPGGKKLIWSEDSNVVDFYLRRIARQRNLPYLRVTLRDQDDFNRLMTELTVKDGEIMKKPGRLPEMLKRESIIFIDYTQSDPKFVEALNSLFDDHPYFLSEEVNSGVTIVGNITDEQLEKYPISFYSRFHNNKDFTADFNDPISSIEEVPSDVYLPNAGMVGIDFYGEASSRLIYDQLIGSYHINENGQIEAIPGSIIDVIRMNQEKGTNKPLVIQDGRWDQPYLPDLIRQVLLEGEVTFNGETVKIPKDFKIYKQKVDRSLKVDGFNLVLPQEAKNEGELWIINSQNQDILWGHTKVSEDHRLVATEGVLGMKRNRPVRIRIVDNLEDWVWNRLMQAYDFSEIEIAPGVVLPLKVRAYMSKGLKKLQRPQSPLNWKDHQGELKNEKVLVVAGNDLDFIRSEIQETFGEETFVYPVTTETSYQELVDATDVEILGENIKIFKSRTQEIIKELREGKTVVLEGIDINESLYKELETAFCEEPYIYSNGERIDLNQLRGKLIVTLKNDSPLKVTAKNYLSMTAGPEEYQERIRNEFSDIFQEQDYQKALSFYELLETIPAPAPGLYPERPVFNLSRLRLLYEFRQGSNWLDAVEKVIISSYIESKEVASYLRVMARLLFSEDYEGQSTNSIHGKKLVETLNQLPQGIEWSERFWELADTLSLDLLKKSQIGRNYLRPNSEGVYRIIQDALIAKNKNSKTEEMYRALFQRTEDVEGSAKIDDSLSAFDFTWQELRDQIIYILGVTRGVMLKGSPGTGKSFITDEIARELNYTTDQIYGPVTTGTDTQETDIISDVRVIDKKTTQINKVLGRWANDERGGILIVDEANLPFAEFWNFLKGAFDKNPYVWINGEKKRLTDRHLIVFTGNQETLEDRSYIDIVENYMVTVPFNRFTKSFMRQRANDYVSAKKKDRKKLVDLVVDLHFFFQQMNPEIEFSLRDIQELSDRINIFTQSDWTIDEVVELAWEIYKGNFSLEEQKAFHFLLVEKYGVEVEVLQKQKNQEIKEQWQDIYRGTEDFQSSEISLVDSAAEMVGSILDFLKVRSYRLQGKTRIQGKRGMIYEGFSGRGKDAILLKTLKEQGFVDGTNGVEDVEGAQKYYRLNGSLDYDEIVEKIQRAKEEGAIVIISEANLLKSGFLEGKLNDLLTGNAHQGFAIFITINSVDFGGREKFSSALQNRMIYKRIMDYNESELIEIAQDILRPFPAMRQFPQEDILHIVKTHLWIKDQIKDQRYHPTTRDFRRAFANVSGYFPQGKYVNGEEKTHGGRTFEDILKESYGPLFLTKILKGKSLPLREELIRYRPVNPLNMEAVQEHMANFIIPKVWGPVEIRHDASDANQEGGYFSRKTKNHPSFIGYRSKGLETGEWIDTTYHEGAHGIFNRRFTRYNYYRTIDGFLDPMNDLVQDMDDLQDMNSMTHYYPFTTVNSASQEDILFSDMIASLDFEYMLSWTADRDPLTRRKMFQMSLMAIAKGLISEEQLQVFADAIDGLIEEVNPFQLALNHVDAVKKIATLVPQSLEEEEILNKKFEAIQLVETMKEDFLSIPFDENDEKISDEEQEKADLNRGKKALNENQWEAKDRRQEIQRQKIKPLTSEEIARRKQKILEEKKKREEATKEEILKQFDLIESHLNHPYGVTTKRLEEIKNQLTNDKVFYSYSRRIKQLEDETINERRDAILKRVKGFKKNTQKDGSARTEKTKPIGALYGPEKKTVTGVNSGGFGVHTKQKDMRSNPVRVSPPKVKRKEVVLSTKEKEKRNQTFATMTSVIEGELEKVLNFLQSTKMEANKVYGTRGTLDIYEFIFGDATRAYVSSGGVATKVKKEIVLKGDLKGLQWNPILEELFHFLFSQNFTVTVYSSAYSFVDNIKTLGDLKRILLNTDSVSSAEIEKDLLKRKTLEEFEVIDMLDLQKKVEEVYAYMAFKTVLEGELSAERKEGEMVSAGGIEVKEPHEMNLDEQYVLVKELIAKSDFAKFFGKHDQGNVVQMNGAIKITIECYQDGSKISPEDFENHLLHLFLDLSKFPLIESFTVKGDLFTGEDVSGKINILGYLHLLPNLRWINADFEDIDDNKVIDFFKAHKRNHELVFTEMNSRIEYRNQKMEDTGDSILTKINAQGKLEPIADLTKFIRQEEKAQPNTTTQMSFDDQVNEIQKIAQEWGLASSEVIANSSLNSISLDLTKLKQSVELSRLSKFTNLREIIMPGDSNQLASKQDVQIERVHKSSQVSLSEISHFILSQHKKGVIVDLYYTDGSSGINLSYKTLKQLVLEMIFRNLGMDESRVKVEDPFGQIKIDLSNEISILGYFKAFYMQCTAYGIEEIKAINLERTGIDNLDFLKEVEEIGTIYIDPGMDEDKIFDFYHQRWKNGLSEVEVSDSKNIYRLTDDSGEKGLGKYAVNDPTTPFAFFSFQDSNAPKNQSQSSLTFEEQYEELKSIMKELGLGEGYINKNSSAGILGIDLYDLNQYFDFSRLDKITSLKYINMKANDQLHSSIKRTAINLYGNPHIPFEEVVQFILKKADRELTLDGLKEKNTYSTKELKREVLTYVLEDLYFDLNYAAIDTSGTVNFAFTGLLTVPVVFPLLHKALQSYGIEQLGSINLEETRIADLDFLDPVQSMSDVFVDEDFPEEKIVEFMKKRNAKGDLVTIVMNSRFSYIQSTENGEDGVVKYDQDKQKVVETFSYDEQNFSQPQTLPELSFDEQVEEAKRIMMEEAGVGPDVVSSDDSARKIIIDFSRLKKSFDLRLLDRITFLESIVLKKLSLVNPAKKETVFNTYHPDNIFPLDDLLTFALKHKKVGFIFRKGSSYHTYLPSELKLQVAQHILGIQGKAENALMGGLSVALDRVTNNRHKEIINDFVRYGLTHFQNWDLTFANVTDLSPLYAFERIDTVEVKSSMDEETILDFLTIDPNKFFSVENRSFAYGIVINQDEYIIEKDSKRGERDKEWKKTFNELKGISGGVSGKALDETSQEFLERIIQSLVDQQGSLKKVRMRFVSEGEEKRFDTLLDKLFMDDSIKKGIKKEDVDDNALAVNLPNKLQQNQLQEKTEDLGGIDFNPANLKMNVSGDTVEFNLPKAEVQTPANIDGLIPVIINITPIPNLQLYLGKVEEQNSSQPELSLLENK